MNYWKDIRRKRYEVNDEYKLYCPDCVDWDKENECYKLKDKKQ